MNLKSLLIATITLLILPFSFARAKENTNSQTKSYKIRWLMAHEPVRVFERAAKQFKQEVEANSNGRLEVEILTSTEYMSKYQPSKKHKKGANLDDVMLVKDGQIEMTQTYTTELGRLNPKMWVLDLPFLFKDHAHAKKVIDGEIGQSIMAGLTENQVKGLAFTYSGGYRVISSRDNPITSVNDFKNLNIRIARSPVTKAMYEILGAKSFELSHKAGIQGVVDGKLSAAETTIARFDESQQKATPILNDTQHSLFLTSMVVNNKFYETLPNDLQKIVSEAAKRAAEAERLDSLSDESQLRKSFSEKGFKVVSMPAAEIQKMQKITHPLYQQFAPMFGADLIKSIETAR